ncbi:hypothetical protein [Microbulbifer sp. Q7]|uniref:hypothetical protein n=1 Tax=Microbulbifer sp. Q7 TaxID=1785091 RepID=UPI000832E378|nr:hypothetical protein [Microbulbifer sp. Q7]
MGLAFCKKHGETGITPNISVEICEDQSKGSLGKIQDICIVNIKIFDGDEYLYTQENYISKAAFDEAGMNFEYIITCEEDEEKINVFFPETSGMCSACFKEYIISRNIKLHGC